jgi:serine/threonine-protein kinase
MNPTRLGRFEIIREIGKGAMGQVFLANDPKIGRQVAIKTIVLPAGTSPEEAHETSQRFLREAQAAGKLLHPNIVTIFDVGEDAGVSFIAMEFIEGGTLEKHTRPGTLLPLRRVQDLMTQAAAALDHAHQHAIVHRDIKPANLMLLKTGMLKVTDFGLAKSPQANITQAGVLLGTPSYMSPEQIQGHELDGRSDLFSLGVVLYELLTGARPFEGDSISTIIYRVLYEDPRPPAAHNPALPPEINVILARALAKERDGRYAACAALVADLNKAFAGLPPETLTRPFPVVAAPASAAAPGAPSPTLRRPPRGAGKRAARPGPAAPERSPEGGRQSFLARHPAKIVALALTGLLAVVLFPRLADRPERTVAEAAPGVAAPAEPRLTAAALGSPPAAGPAAGGTSGQVVIDVETIPHGGTVFVDDVPLAEPRVVLSLADPSPHDIIARSGCRQAIAEMTAKDLASFSGPLVLELQPRVEDVMIVSNPPNARIRLNGRDTGKLTPAVLTLAGCDKRVLALEREGYRPWTATYEAGDDFDAMIRTLKQVALEAIPAGTIVVKRPAEYDVDVFLGGRRLGKAGEPIDLPEGKHTLTFRNEKFFVHETAQVTVAAGRTTTPVVTLPLLGSLTVQAQPSNCKVFVDGTYVDVTPVLEVPIASGGHRVKVVFVPTGTEQEVPVTVHGGKNSLVTVKF